MSPLSLEQVLKATNGKALSQFSTNFKSVGTDSRKDLTGQLFIALKGDAFDAHNFLAQAQKAGAAGLLVSHLPESQKEVLKFCTVIQVQDTLKALQDLGRWVRRQVPTKILGLTGSNGKTSTKEFTAQILSNYKNVHYSQGSFNNHWGVPFSLLELEATHEVAVIEMGMNHKGEIEQLVKIAEPDVVVCTMVGRAHIEFFGTQEKIAEAKQEIYLHSNPNSLAIFNLDNSFTYKMWEQEKIKNPSRPMLLFSEYQNADVQLKLESVSFEGLHLKGHIAGQAGEVFVPIFGQHNITNLLAAASLALATGLKPDQIWQGLKSCRSHWGRNQKVKLKSGAIALFDAYNANPDSMEALLENVKSISAPRKIGVFGQMRELGDLSQQLHEKLGYQVGQVGFKKIYFYGDDVESFKKGLLSSGFQGASFLERDFQSSLAESLSSDLQKDDFLVFKASRGLKLERMLLVCDPLDFEEKK